ncbi:MAG: hypothetical protein LBS76_03655 [Mycoplasmataceae bacterium]|jgi:hypothetical protein|nr:hypothetical protein [Mycoplasmataceae bacterium]
MSAVTQNKIGTITLTDELIRQSVMGFASENKHYKLIDLSIQQNETNRFSFYLTYASKNKKTNTIVSDLDELVNNINKMIESNLQIFGSIILAKIGN